VKSLNPTEGTGYRPIHNVDTRATMLRCSACYRPGAEVLTLWMIICDRRVDVNRQYN
jgi:hypothetical protein